VVKGQGKEGNEDEEGEEDESCESGAGDEPTPSSELEGPGAQTDAGAFFVLCYPGRSTIYLNCV
jgi:hypothetical protein